MPSSSGSGLLIRESRVRVPPLSPLFPSQFRRPVATSGGFPHRGPPAGLLSRSTPSFTPTRLSGRHQGLEVKCWSLGQTRDQRVCAILCRCRASMPVNLFPAESTHLTSVGELADVGGIQTHQTAARPWHFQRRHR